MWPLYPNFIKSKFATWILLPVFVLALVGFGKVYFQKRTIDKEIAKLQEQADKIQQDNEQLSSLIKYYNTPQYQEKQAREKLNLKKEGEYVIALPDSNGESAADAAAQQTKASNLKAWFNYFFHAN